MEEVGSNLDIKDGEEMEAPSSSSSGFVTFGAPSSSSSSSSAYYSLSSSSVAPHTAANSSSSLRSSSGAGTKTEVLADIFNKIAEFEVTKSDSDYMQMLISHQLSEEELQNCEAKAATDFNNSVELSSSSSELAESKPSAQQQKELINNLFQIQFSKLDIIENEIKQELLPKFKALSRKESALVADKTSLLRIIEINEIKTKELQELCRNVQRKNKESEEEIEKIRQAGISRTFSLGQSCQSSIDDVLISLQNEEDAIKKKQLENEELTQKLIEFKSHLSAHSKQIEAQKRAVDLQNQLVVAKRAQWEHHTQQCQLLSENYAARLGKQVQNVNNLQAQVHLYRSKFSEFENSIEETKKVFKHFENKAKESAAKALQLEENTNKILNKADRKHIELDKLKKEKQQIEDQKAEFDKQSSALEVDCRKLATERAALSKQLKELQQRYPENYQQILQQQLLQQEASEGSGKQLELNQSESQSCDIVSPNDIDISTKDSALPSGTASQDGASDSDDDDNHQSANLTFDSSHPSSSSSGSSSEGSSGSSSSSSSSSSASSSSSSSHRRNINTPLSPGED